MTSPSSNKRATDPPPPPNRLKPLKHKLDPQVCSKAARYAVRVAEEMSKRSKLLGSSSNSNVVATFERHEILPGLGDVLGKGGFNSVYELDQIHLDTEQQNKSEDNKAAELRQRLAQQPEQLAVKFLSDDCLYHTDEFCNGAADLLMEAKYLTALAAHPHPCLIQLHAVGSSGPSGFAQPCRAGFFLVIDRLYDTLDRRIDVWKELESRRQGETKALQALVLQRLVVALDIASALRHLHKLDIVFRDLKPDNVGFGFDGSVKLFDFGLAKELDPHQKLDNGLYQMSGGTGSRRFMAPEVALSEPYYLSADIYSFAILFWEILTLSKAFGNLSPDEHRERVIEGGQRLDLSADWSTGLQDLLQSCWHGDSQKRPTARDICKTLRHEIAAYHEQAGFPTAAHHHKSSASLETSRNHMSFASHH